MRVEIVLLGADEIDRKERNKTISSALLVPRPPAQIRRGSNRRKSQKWKRVGKTERVNDRVGGYEICR